MRSISAAAFALSFAALAAAPAEPLPAPQDAPPAAPATAPAASPAAAKGFTVEALPAVDGKSSVPSEVSEPFAKLLASEGVRVLAPDGKVRADFWFRLEMPLLAKAGGVSSVLLERLVPGAFVGIVRTPGRTNDYRDQEIEAGVYALRYYHQPSDANHLGTSDSRDFFLLTSLAEEKSPAPIAAKDDLIPLAVAASPSDHALCLYVAPATTPPPTEGTLGGARVAKRGEHDEQALEITFAARVEGTDQREALRLAIVIDGHTAH
ncbi:MAG: hypothetical protein JNL90_05255 [Planctomycetes bacterium]|nr:hypothetical protein [Planctomycetota bacterium]